MYHYCSELEQAPSSSELGTRAALNWVGCAGGFALLDLEAAKSKILRGKVKKDAHSEVPNFVAQQ